MTQLPHILLTRSHSPAFSSLLLPITSLDMVVQEVISSSEDLNQIQYIFMCIEGIVVPIITALFVGFITIKTMRQRHNLYSIFLVVPMAVLRNLVAKCDVTGQVRNRRPCLPLSLCLSLCLSLSLSLSVSLSLCAPRLHPLTPSPIGPGHD